MNHTDLTVCDLTVCVNILLQAVYNDVLYMMCKCRKKLLQYFLWGYVAA